MTKPKHYEPPHLPEPERQALRVRFDRYKGEVNKFELIPAADRPHESPFICACIQVAALSKDPANFSLGEHYGSLVSGSPIQLVSLDDDNIQYLVRCGVYYDWYYDMLCFNY